MVDESQLQNGGPPTGGTAKYWPSVIGFETTSCKSGQVEDVDIGLRAAER